MGLLLNVAGGGAAHLRAVRSTRTRKHATIRAMRERARIAIAAGGTAGHVVPALAVADALRERGAEVLFIGGDRAERTLVPAAGYPLERLAVSGLDRRNPLRAAAGAAGRRRARAARARALLRRGAHRRRARRRRLRRRAGRAGRADAAHPDRPDRGRQPPRADQPRCSRRSRARVCLAFPIEGRSGARYRVTGPPGARRRPPTATAARAAFGDRAVARSACSCSAARSGRGRSTRRRSTGLDGAALPRAARDRRARLAGAARAPARPALRPARVPRPRRSSGRRSRPATSSSRAPAARSSRSPPTAGRRSSCPSRRASADHQRTNAALDGARRARPSWWPTAS